MSLHNFNNFFARKYDLLVNKSTSVNIKRLGHGDLQSTHKVNQLEKRFLVWTGKFKKMEDVPSMVDQSTMERARNRMRIKIANYMMIATAVGCIAMVYLGKQAAKKGESVVKDNIEWHKRMNAREEGKQ